MKKYEVYQVLEGEPMSDRDKREATSKFWGEGKFNNFVKPFLKKEFEKETLIDMGCNKGLFLKMAEEMGFNAIGVDSNAGAIEAGKRWRDENGYNYDLRQFSIENCIDTLPMADYTVLANAHYYFTVNDWLEYVDVMQYKTRYVIIVTDEKHHLQRCWASADVRDIREVFKNWDEVGFIDVMSQDDPAPRKLRSLCFKSRFIDKMSVDTIDSSNHVQDEFYAQLDEGMDYKDTKYYKIIHKYRIRDHGWEPERLEQWFQERIKVYENIKKNGVRVPIILDKDNRILDGNHRYSLLKHLGFKDVFVRKI